MSTIEKVNAVIGSIERILDTSVFRKKKDHPVVKLSRVALVRQLFWAEQYSAAVQDGENYDEALKNMLINQEIINACADDLRECLKNDS